MAVPTPQTRDLRVSEQGFTLPEVLIVIVIMGIVFAIASVSWQGVVESRHVDSATNQVAADLRLAHSAATNRLGAARLILRADGGTVSCNGTPASYCLTRPRPDGTTEYTPRYLPPEDAPLGDRVKLTSPNILADPGGLSLPGVVGGTTSTIEFASNGSAKALGSLGAVGGVPDDCPAGTPTGVPKIRVASPDNDPRRCLTFNAVTSRIRVN